MSAGQPLGGSPVPEGGRRRRRLESILPRVCAIQREADRAPNKNSRVSFAAKLYNLLDKNYYGSEMVINVKNKQSLNNQCMMNKVRLTSSSSREDLKTRRGDIITSRKGKDKRPERDDCPAPTPPNKPSKRLLMLLLAEQRQKNQESEDELRLIKLKLQQEIKSRR